MQVLVLGLGEVFFLVKIFPVDGAGHIEAGVADTLQLGNLTEHVTDLGLGLIGQMGIAYLVKVIGYLKLHIVGDALVFLYP